MKKSFHLTEAEIKTAIAFYLKQAKGLPDRATVHLSASTATDCLDRPTGGYAISATAEFVHALKEKE